MLREGGFSCDGVLPRQFTETLILLETPIRPFFYTGHYCTNEK